VRENGRLAVRRPVYRLSGMRKRSVGAVGAILGSLLTLALSGCSGRNPFLSYGPAPRVEDCAQIQQATPTKYVCGGKIYTSVQLTNIRNGKPLAQ
jgi:hypothetical protein